MPRTIDHNGNSLTNVDSLVASGVVTVATSTNVTSLQVDDISLPAEDLSSTEIVGNTSGVSVDNPGNGQVAAGCPSGATVNQDNAVLTGIETNQRLEEDSHGCKMLCPNQLRIYSAASPTWPVLGQTTVSRAVERLSGGAQPVFYVDFTQTASNPMAVMTCILTATLTSTGGGYRAGAQVRLITRWRGTGFTPEHYVLNRNGYSSHSNISDEFTPLTLSTDRITFSLARVASFSMYGSVSLTITSGDRHNWSFTVSEA